MRCGEDRRVGRVMNNGGEGGSEEERRGEVGWDGTAGIKTAEGGQGA